MTHIIELIILAVILIGLWNVGKNTDERLDVLKEDLDKLDYQVECLNNRFPQIKEPLFKDKIKKEEKRMSELLQKVVMQERCDKCNGPFLSHHKVKALNGGQYHTRCMPKVGNTKKK